MPMWLLQIGSALFYGAVAFWLYITISMRLLLVIRDSPRKLFVTLTTLLLWVGGATVFGFFHWTQPWLTGPLLVLAGLLVGQLHMLRLRRAYGAVNPEQGAFSRVAISAPVTTTDLAVYDFVITSSKWRGTPLRIAHISDLHVGPALQQDYYREVFDVAERAQPDLAVFTGDFITHTSALSSLRQVLRPLAGASNFAVLGNHDYWSDPDGVRAILRETDIRLLEHEPVELDLGDRRLLISACNAPWGGRQCVSLPTADGLLHLALSHAPDNIYRLVRAGVDVVFAGHCHAGQLRAPLLGSLLVPSVYGRRFDHGHFQVHGTHLFVSGGVGTVHPPFRLFCRPDIFIVEIRAEAG